MVNALIAVGDFVLYLVKMPADLLTTVRSKKRIRSGTFKIKTSKKRPSLIAGFKWTKNNLAILLRPAIFIFKAPLNLFHLYQINSEKTKKDKLAKKRREARVKNGLYKPSIPYKLKYVFVGILISFIFLFLPLVSLLFVSELPNPSNLSVNYIPKTTKIYDRNGTLLYEIFANQNRTIVALSDIPKNLANATIAIEDKDFYSHPGFDLRGITRALITNIQKRGFQGGSTITQQLIKSAFLTPEPTITRKIKEVALAFWAERIYTKDQILELYLNYVPYGGTAWGVESASDVYFGKKVSNLTLAESAFLAGLPRAPSFYSPFFGDGEKWRRRQKEVLDAMVRLSYINQNEADTAYEEKLTFRSPNVPIKAPHFVMHVRKILIDKFGLNEVERGGLNVTTSLDLAAQDKAERIVQGEVESNAHLNIGNGAALITTPQNGDILAMVGSRNYFDQDYDGNVNLTTSLRQPGSAIKLVTYALALSKGYTEATILDDSPLTITNPGGPSYSPVNYDGVFHGRIPLRTAFANSFNIPPVRIAQKLGAALIREQGEKMGISSWNGVRNYGVSITLGGVDVRMTDMASAYGVVANGGQRVDIDPLLEIKDSYGKTVYKKNPTYTPVIDEGVAFIISDILSDNNARRIEFGLDTPLNIPGARVSVKTGTTDNKRDNWTIGYTPNVLVATWVGNNDNSPMNPVLASGITGAAPMWNKIMTMMLEKLGTPSASIVPSNVIKKFCLGQDRYFIKGTENSVNCRGVSGVTISPSPQTN